METKTYNQDYVTSYSKQLGEPNWLTDLRLQALAKSEDLPMPRPDKTKIDKWNFTSFKEHIVTSEKLNSLNDLHEDVKALIDIESANNNLYVQLNNTAAYTTLSNELKEKGVILADIHTAASEHSELVQKYFMKDGVKVDEHRLTALHAALLNGGVFVYVPKNVEVAEPIQAVFVHDNPNTTLFNHVIVVAEDNSSVTYVENYISTIQDVEGVFNIITEVFANTNARVTYGAVDTLAK
jgi:Fe-S cluster assembly protein SufD